MSGNPFLRLRRLDHGACADAAKKGGLAVDMRTVARTCLLAGLLLAMAGCGGAPVAKAPASPSVRILSPTNGQKEVGTGPVTVTVRLSISHFTMVLGGSGAAGSGQVWLYENGKFLTQMITTSLPILLQPGTYTLKAVLITSGKVVASSAPILVSVTASASSTPISTSTSGEAALTKACDTQPSGATQSLKPGTITLFCKGLPAGDSVSSLVIGPGGNLWFIEGPPGPDIFGVGIGRITPSGTITVFTKGLPTGSPVSGRLVVGPGDDLWFTVAGSGIGRITPSGAITVFTNGMSALPAGSQVSRLMMGPDGNLWFTGRTASLCSGGTNIPSIGRITPSGAITVFTKGLSALPANGYLDPLVLGSDGDLWFADTSYSNTAIRTTVTGSGIGRIAPSGAITMFSKGLPANSQISYPGLMTGPGGNLWFTDQTFTVSSTGSQVPGPYLIGRITPSGVITMFSKGLPANSQIFQLMTGPGGNLWFTDQTFTVSNTGSQVPGPYLIGRITPSGVITMFSKGLPANSANSNISGLMTGPDGNLWFTDVNSIGRITPSGAITMFAKGLPANSANSNISGLMTGPDGNLWFTDVNSIGRITPSGVITMFSKGLPANSQISYPGLMTGPDGNLWFEAASSSGTPAAAVGRLIP